MSQPYCNHCQKLPLEDVHRIYHDTKYGRRITDDNELFARLVLEINQAGLSWDTILKKEKNFYAAYKNFVVSDVAALSDSDITLLLNDAGIIRNKLKINAARHNAQVILLIQQEHGSLLNWLDLHTHYTHAQWVSLFKKTFKFTGGEIVSEFLMSTGYLPNSHSIHCPVYSAVMKEGPSWAKHPDIHTQK